MTIAHVLAQFLTETRYEELPPQAVLHAKMIVASTFASAACGIDIPSASLIRDLEMERGGRGEASVWFHGNSKLPLVGAARVNAMMSDAAASDDSDLRNIVHAGTPMTAAVLACAERERASGKEVLAALVLGYEAAGRIADSITPGFNQQGFHGCLGAIFAAAVGAARILRLDAVQMAHTIALSATSIGGLMAAANTSVSREYHAGLAAMLGLEAAIAAQRGYTGELSILETTRGFCEVYGGTDGSGIVDELGRDWDIVTDMAIKLVPGGHPYHAFGEAAANASREGNVQPDDVESIVVARPGLHEFAEPLHPQNLIDMAHSPAYFTAAGVADQSFGWEHASPEKINDPVIHALIDKITVGEPPTENVEAYRKGARVTIRTTSGVVHTSTVHIPKGAGCLGIDWSDIDAKYRALVLRAPLNEGAMQRSLAAIHALDEALDVSALLRIIELQ
jgi:2-methylcitrate dehydratase PrpD